GTRSPRARVQLGGVARLCERCATRGAVARTAGVSGIAEKLRVGIADHFGWAVAITASFQHEIVDRRRIELVEPGVPEAPIHSESKHLDDAGVAALVAEVRASVVRASAASLD